MCINQQNAYNILQSILHVDIIRLSGLASFLYLAQMRVFSVLLDASILFC